MLVVAVLVAVCVASGTSAASGLDKPYYDLEDAENLFQEFIKQHGKVYDRSEYYERLDIFMENLRDINRRNEEYPQTVFAVNHFADLKPEEMQQYYGFKLSNETIEKVTFPLSPNGAPDKLDWRKQGVVSHVKDQKNCGSCYIFSAIGNIEGQYAIKHKQCLVLSEGQALDCLNCGTCKGGMMDKVMTEFSEKDGIMKEDDYPYNPQKGTCHEDASKVAVKVQSSKVLKIPDEDTLKDNLAQIGPLAVGLNAEDFHKYKGGILEPKLCKGKPLNHGVVLVGYGKEGGKPFWIIKNSWGKDWGESGYVRLLRGVNACGMGTSYTATATVD